jgi:hypothetical protein
MNLFLDLLRVLVVAGIVVGLVALYARWLGAAYFEYRHGAQVRRMWQRWREGEEARLAATRKRGER